MSKQDKLISRRRFLILSCLSILGAVAALSDVRASIEAQKNWRFCHRCNVLFFDGGKNKGSCPAPTGGAHEAEAMGFNFSLPLCCEETPTQQRKWRRCLRCQALFFDGFRKKGPCSAGGDHAADRNNQYFLGHSHSVSGNKNLQPDWRFCDKCLVMFFTGPTAHDPSRSEQKGRCAAGGAHRAVGFVFVLSH
jgi:hypothetical protein